MRRALLLAAFMTPVVALPIGGAAQPAPGAAPLAETELHIGERAEVTRAPDEVVATLRAEARAGSAAAAQEAVNRAVTAAVARARAVQGVRVSTGGYWTNRVDQGRSWQAAQQITLRGTEATALLELAGTLQEQGLAMGGLHWQLTRDAARAAREEASRLALEALRRRAQAVADQLGLQMVGLKEVRIDAPDHGDPRPMMAMAARSASAAPPPVAVAEDVVVSAAVQAVAILRPR
ncbi:SIMPL domain-containing protein [Falsiroseomonas sp.]|uniref:SIMPL domain-containing protein n=1 Tax=Falsiroseomonas sp. TaxID=2870721 RepID=UPI003564E55B